MQAICCQLSYSIQSLNLFSHTLFYRIQEYTAKLFLFCFVGWCSALGLQWDIISTILIQPPDFSLIWSSIASNESWFTAWATIKEIHYFYVPQTPKQHNFRMTKWLLMIATHKPIIHALIGVQLWNIPELDWIDHWKCLLVVPLLSMKWVKFIVRNEHRKRATNNPEVTEYQVHTIGILEITSWPQPHF